MHEEDPRVRFSKRAVYYWKYRPRYPEALHRFVEQELGLVGGSIIADVGSGTGILSELFVKRGYTVFAIEPNREMRSTAEELLRNHSNFKSIDATAENTTLPSASVDFITAGQAFHWFDPIKAKFEFLRILEPGGWVLLIWNVRKLSTGLMSEYDTLVNEFADRQFAYRTTKDRIGEAGLRSFLGQYREKRFENRQVFDLEGLQGRLLSSSYVPLPGEERFEAMIVELRRIFNSFQKEGLVHFDYETEVYYSQLQD
ncbi:MAG TPA: class I SAM-dependent methyltransferase [Methylomirabilota bacterium]|nr:class I SAM-dependent methyltransferase [Methylomirabilota bacterium]